MHALVTGGAGFIGSHLVDRLLAHGHRVTVVDDLSTGRPDNLDAARAAGGDRLTVHVADVATAALAEVVAADPPDVAFHLAAQISVRRSVADPVGDATTNVVGAVTLLEAARRHGVRKVVNTTSGGCVYGEPPWADLPVAESYPGTPHSPYGASKMAAEGYLQTFESLHGLRWTSLALGNVYGPRQDPAGGAGVVSIFAGAMVRDEEMVVYGDGHQTRDFVYVGDVVTAYLAAAGAALRRSAAGRAHHPQRVTGHDRTGRHLAVDHGGGAHDRVVADAGAGQQHRSLGQPYVVAHRHDRFGVVG